VKFPKPGDFVDFVHTEWEESTSHWRSTNCFSGQGSHAVVGRKLFDNMETISKKKWQTTMPWTDDIPVKDNYSSSLLGNREGKQPGLPTKVIREL